MGQIPDKTYTAPDGSVYRVESDGSVTKKKIITSYIMSRNQNAKLLPMGNFTGLREMTPSHI